MDAWNGANRDVGKDLLKGTAIAGVTGATAGGIIGILRQKPVGAYAFSGGLNASLFGMTFIAFRESFLRLQREKNPYYGLKDSQTMDIDHLWSSTIAGAFTGGILAALARGPKSVPSGTFMFGVMAMGGQWVLTKTNRYRQDRILTSTVPLESLPASSPLASSRSSNSRDAVGTGILSVLPVHRTDVDDYEVKLRQKLELIEREQAILKEEVLRRERVAVDEAVEEKVV
ncbi:hypothetical protein EC957_004513 [Mortierella hygrophila]|uniref:Uncharacterized protein n=1 Tax=Mortierella hygrophila TaxID=979708 RepID=A0A9P6FEU3_9FUNG|nr:hypothetical protein EC957_004513 [Mortierella hygrophila]